MAHAVFVLNVFGDVLKTLPHSLPWLLRIHAVHKDLTVLLAKGRQKMGGWNTTSEMLPHSHFHTAIVSTWWRNSTELKTPLQTRTLGEFPSKNFRSPFYFSELSSQHLPREGLLWGTLRYKTAHLTLCSPQHGKFLYFRDPLSIVQVIKIKTSCVPKNLPEMPKIINLCFLDFWIPNLNPTGKGNHDLTLPTLWEDGDTSLTICLSGAGPWAPEETTWGRSKSPTN